MLTTNEYIIGDNLDVLKQLNEDGVIVDLIYFDPPYNTGRDFNDFQDSFKDSFNFREEFLRPRIEIMFNILSENGSIVVHVDPTISHHIRIILDDIFGEKNFLNEIVWKSGGNKKSTKKLMRFHDTIIVYSKTKKYKFNPQYLPYDDDYKKNNTIKIDTRGEYTTSAAHNSQPDVIQRPNLRYEWNGVYKQWWWSIERMQELHNDSRLEYNNNGIPRVKKYLNEMSGIPIRDLWLDINQIQGEEKLNYATQKPVKLLERIVKIFSNENDLVLDPFAGSGTTGRACKNLNRNFILIDMNEKGKKIFEEKI